VITVESLTKRHGRTTAVDGLSSSPAEAVSPRCSAPPLTAPRGRTLILDK
jgi:hypothetical protein